MNITKFYNTLVENKDIFDRANDRYLDEVYTTLLEMINEEIAKEAEKSAGRKANVRSAVKKFIDTSGARPILSKANIQTIDGVDYYGYCDGFKIAWSPVDFNLGVNEKGLGLNWLSVIDIKYNKKGIIPITPELKTELGIALKTDKRKPFVVHGEGDYTILFNPAYLKACFDFTEATEMIVDLGSDVKPAVMHGVEDRHALCLPIRK